MVFAFMDRKADALREGRLAASLMPIGKDAILGPVVVQDLARIYVLCGEFDQAVDQIQIALGRSPYMSVQRLRNEPQWDPLRGNPRFEALVAAES